MCRATQKAACRVPVTCRCVTGVRPHTRHAPRGPECGAREQSAAVPPPRARPRPRVHLRSSAARSGSRLPHSGGQRTASARGAGRRRGRERARGGAGRGGQGWPTRIALGIPTAAIRHTACLLACTRPHRRFQGGELRVRARSRSRAGARPVFKFFYPRCQNPRGT